MFRRNVKFELDCRRKNLIFKKTRKSASLMKSENFDFLEKSLPRPKTGCKLPIIFEMAFLDEMSSLNLIADVKISFSKKLENLHFRDFS